MAEQVSLNLYDLSQGMARQLSQTLLGFHLEGIWHSGIVFRGREYFFGGGIFEDPAERTPYGRPDKKLILGTTTKTTAEFAAFLDSIRPRFRMQDYDLVRHNCNNFTNECSMFLVGKGIPQDILDLPARALSTPIGQMLRPQIEAYRDSRVQEFAGVDAEISRNSNPHASLHLPLFTQGKPIAFATGSLDKAVERLGQILREQGLSLLATDSILALGLVTNAASFASTPAEKLAPLIADLIAALKSLPPQDHYPLFDMLRVVCLHAQGPSLLLKHAEISNVLSMVFASVAHRLSFVASLRLVQNLLLVGSDAALASSPLDVSTAKFVVAGINSDQVQVRKGAAFAAYNFALAMQKKGEDEASVVFVSGIANYLKAPLDALDSYEFLSLLLSLGTIFYGHLKLVSLFRSFKVDLEKFRPNANQQLSMTLDSLTSIMNL